VFFRSGVGFTPELPIIPSDEEDIREGTRQMIPVHLKLPNHLIRFVACHWTAFDNSSSRVARERLADVLKRNCQEFLKPPVPTMGITRHVVILGDLNEEPTARVFRERLIGCRDRQSSRYTHWQDKGVRRVRLYNAAWRYLGEQVAHGTAGQPVGAAGTLYNIKKGGWRTLDHLLVSAELLGQTPLYLDEAKSRIVSTPLMRDGAGLPAAFTPTNQRGISDHLPIIGRLVLPEPSA
jgi:endonuclease/exonuclease/phosphatase family metal-dependent hydrolase